MTIRELFKFLRQYDEDMELEVKTLFFNGAILPAIAEYKPPFKDGEKGYILIKVK